MLHVQLPMLHKGEKMKGNALLIQPDDSFATRYANQAYEPACSVAVIRRLAWYQRSCAENGPMLGNKAAKRPAISPDESLQGCFANWLIRQFVADVTFADVTNS